jgi:hypothetical protein
VAVPTYTTWTAAKLEGSEPIAVSWIRYRYTYAAVAAKISTRRAPVKSCREKENAAVSPAIAPSLFAIVSKVCKTTIERTGRMLASVTASNLVTRRTLARGTKEVIPKYEDVLSWR